jgi:mycothiol synthase
MTDELDDLIARAQAFDGTPPFSDGALVQFANGERELVWEFDSDGNRVGAALDSPTAAEFVVDPDARGHGHGARMLDMLTHPSRGGAAGTKLFWAHGDHPAARALARHHKLEPVRTLLHLRLTHLPAGDLAGTTAFTPADADEWLALNARTFADHPDQGSITRDQFELTMAEPWFDAGDFLLLRQAGELVGYVWLKLSGGEGEFYVVGVAPEHQGGGLGGALMGAGFARLAERGIHSAHLYVEADNAAALRLYREFGFVEAGADVQYHYVR